MHVSAWLFDGLVDRLSPAARAAIESRLITKDAAIRAHCAAAPW